MKFRTKHRIFRIQNRIMLHVLFWILCFFILLSIFTEKRAEWIDYIYTAIFLCSILIPVYLNLYVFMPLLLRNEKYLLYSLAFVTLISAFSLFNQFLFEKLIDFILPGYYFISYYALMDIMIFFFVFIMATTLIKLSKEWLELNKNQQEIILLEKEKTEAELRALTHQLNPHFLFNSLNVLYALALSKSSKTPSAIVKLSDILRYVIYEAGKDHITLEAELKLIQNYLDLQAYRSDKNADITFTHDIVDTTVRIAPMLFLPLIENSFKHGIKADISGTYIHIDLHADATTANFRIENNKGADIENKNGVGIRNIRERLRLIYPGQHRFNIKNLDDRFIVELKIGLI